MTRLAEMIEKGLVRVLATVYVNADNGNGLASFFEDMRQNGADAQNIAEDSYEINPAHTDALRPWTGAIWFSHLSDELRAEIKPMLDERGSRELAGKNGEVKIYNNPLFRACVQLGIWQTGSIKNRVAAMQGCQFDAIADELGLLEAELKKARTFADTNRRAGFRELAKDYASRASYLQQRIAILRAQAELILAIAA